MPKELTLKEHQAQKAKRKRMEMGIPPDPVETEVDAWQTLGEQPPEGVTLGAVTSRSDPIVLMYDSEGRQREIPEGSVRVALKEGLSLECPFCGEEHESNDPNACPAREPVKFRVCPVQGCGKRIYDDRADETSRATAADDPNAIPTELPSTPEARTQAKLEAHMLAYHETQARMAGLRSPGELVRR